MTLNEIAVQLASPLGRQFDEPFLAMIKDMVVVWTGRMIRNSLEKDAKDRIFFRTPPLYLPLTAATIDCGGSECPAMVSQELPLPLRANNILFDFVGTQDGHTAFKLIQDGWERFHKETKYAKMFLSYRWNGKRIEVLSNGRPDVIKVTGIWLNPRLLATVLCGTVGCHPDDEEYRVSEDILQLVIQYVRDEELKNYRPQTQVNEVTIDNDSAAESNRS